MNYIYRLFAGQYCDKLLLLFTLLVGVLIVIVVALHLLFYFNTSQNDDPQSFILRHTVNITFCNVLFLSLTHRFVV